MISGFKLSPSQDNFWRFQTSGDGLASPTTQAWLALDGQVHPPAIHAALHRAIARHEILRTTFVQTAGMEAPLQQVHPEGKLNWRIEDWQSETHQSENSQFGKHGKISLGTSGTPIESDRIEQILCSERRELDELTQLPLLRAVLVHCSSKQHHLLLTLPALCADGQTLNVLFAELVQGYGQEEQIPPNNESPPVPYVQVAAWQNQLLNDQDEDALAGHRFWTRQLSGLVPSHFPLRNRIAEPMQDKSVYWHKLAPDLCARLHQQAQTLGIDSAVILLSGLGGLLWRHQISSYQLASSTLTVGVACAGRPYDELSDACGLFTQFLPLNLSLDADITFSTLLARVHQGKEDLEEWQDYFSAQSGLVLPVQFEAVTLPSSQTAGGVTFEVKRLWTRHLPCELRLVAMTRGDAIELEWHYDNALFPKEVIVCLASQLQTLLMSAIQHPEAKLAQLSLLSEEEHQRLVQLRSSTPTPPPAPCLHQWFEQQVERTPHDSALIVADESITYQALNRRANQLAHYLQQAGVQPDDRVALYLDRSIDFMVALLGTLKAGAAYLPLDLALPSTRIAFRLQDARITVLLTQSAFLDRISEYVQVEGASIVCLDRDGEAIAQQPTANCASAVTSSHLAYVIYTSGSTGQPKGVAIEHRQLLNYTQSIIERLALPPAANYAILSTLAADLGHTMLFPCLCQGGTFHLIPTAYGHDVQALATYCQNHPIDCLKIVPSHLGALLDSPQAASILPHQRLVLGGEVCRWSLIERIQTLNPTVQVFNHYGPTESTVGVLTHAVSDALANGTPEGGTSDSGAPNSEALEMLSYTSHTVPLGRAIANTQVYVLDADLQLVAVGITGEIYIGGAGLARAYLHHPALTAAAFIPDPFGGQNAESGGHLGGRLYRTGDLARYLPDGSIEYVGRFDHQVKLHGYRIELGEIEAYLLQHDAVREAAVLLREDEPDNPLLVAYVVLREDEAIAPSDLRPFLRQHLPDYAVPTLVIGMKALPLTPNGKVHRAALPRPEKIRPHLSPQYIAPRTPTETVIAEIWAEVLGLETVGVTDRFFDLGGHSLLATQVLSRLRTTFEVELPLRELFNAQTVAELAELIELALLQDIEALSDDEAEALMQQTSEVS